MIPKIIYTAWFSEDNSVPKEVQYFIDTQKTEGYAHIQLNLDNCFNDHPYIQQCLSSTHKNKKWVKLTDFLRMWYLYHCGGWFIDSDVEMIGDFDSLLNNKMVVGIECAGTITDSIIIGSAIVGAEAGNPVIKEWLDRVMTNFRGDTDDCYLSSMDILGAVAIEFQDQVTFTEPDVFYPYNHHTGITNITKNTICVHHFHKSWIDPTVSFIIPQLGREEGLQKCIDSIKNMDYPQHLIDIHVIEGDETVPVKVQKGVEQSNGSIIVYAANDMTFDYQCLRNAISESKRLDKALVSFNEGNLLTDSGNICTHFLIRRDFLPEIGGFIFDTSMKHRGCDNVLWNKADKLGQAHWCEDCVIEHRHFSIGYPMDEVYMKGWEETEEEKELREFQMSGIVN